MLRIKIVKLEYGLKVTLFPKYSSPLFYCIIKILEMIRIEMFEVDKVGGVELCFMCNCVY